MPLYEFLCQECGEQFTIRVSISEKDGTKCPQCASNEVKQKLGGNFIVPGNSGCQSPPQGGFN